MGGLVDMGFNLPSSSSDERVLLLRVDRVLDELGSFLAY